MTPDLAAGSKGAQIYLRTYIERYRAQIPIRMVQVAGMTAALWYIVSPVLAIETAAFQYALYALLSWRLWRGWKSLADPRCFRRLQMETGLLVTAIVAQLCWVALVIAQANGGHLQREAVILLIALVVLKGLQVHMSILGFLAAVLPPAVVLFQVSLMDRTADAELIVALAVFVAAVLVAAWRQQQADRKAALMTAQLATNNDQLKDALGEAEAERARAEQANRTKSRVLAIASHEIRTPLNVVLGYAEGLRREARTARQLELTEGVRNAGSMLLRLLDAVLDFAKSESGEVSAKPAPFRVPELIENIGSVWNGRAAEHGLELRLNVDPRLQQTAVVSDAARIEQTLINLLSNATKLSHHGAIEVRVSATADWTGAPDPVRLRFEVSDCGPGVRPEDRARIFNPFEQAAEGRAAGGAGLGLAICRSNVALLGGRIGVEAREGGGSVFWFEIAAPTAPCAEAATEPPQAEAVSGRLRILIAEDNPGNRKVLKLLLEPAGVEFDFVENGKAAVEAFAPGRYQLVLMDAMMPVMDGATAVAEIRKDPASLATPIHMLTANVFEDDIRRYYQAGADGVLRKPIDLAALYACLESALAQKGELEQVT